MGVGLSTMQQIGGSIGAAALAAAKISGDIKKDNSAKMQPKDGGKDMKMAAKARKAAQQKINAVMANKEISNKAKTRRVGKILDEYNEGGK